ncbi:hypothetical protein PLESTM_001729400 [Pleodorina starrii]|nr:hypothetical protein PLESTM_001729400 [Pleodorina starrii]
MAQMQCCINELSVQVADLMQERDAVVGQTNSIRQQLQEETAAHSQMDGRRVRLVEEIDALWLDLDDAKESASQASKLQFQVEMQAAQVERVRRAAVVEADKVWAAVEN